jgi:large subunit ribosomal protein L24
MYSVKSLPVRKGDTVKVVRGDFTGIEGKVTEVNANNGRIYLEGVTREKVSGATTKVSVHASKVVIKNLNLDDKWRSEKLKKKQRSAELSEAAVREEQK